MSSNTDAVSDAVPDAPFSPQLLAELHADALPSEVSDRLWPLVRLDAESMRILAGLDDVAARLHEVGEDPTGTLSIPPEITQQIDRTLHSIEQSASADRGAVVVPLRSRKRSLVLAIAAAATVVAAGSAASVAIWQTPDRPEVIAADPLPAESLVLDSADLDPGFAFAIIGKRDSGALSDPADLGGCLAANSIDPATPVLGSSQILLDGRSGTLFVLAGARPAQFVALAVGNDCGVDDPDLLTRRDIG